MSTTPTRAVDHADLVLERRLGDGGQGTVHLVANKRINESSGDGWDVAYKEYHATTVPELDPGALASMVDLVGELGGEDGRWLCETAAWPAAVVEREGRACGFLMRAVPDRFRFDLQGMTAAGVSSMRLATVEYLLNDDAYVAGIGLAISEQDRLALLADLARTLTRLHRIGIAVGDLSPKNLLFATDPRRECFLIDCDAMRLHGSTVLPQAETPDWQIPAGEEKATPASDVYKFGLLAIRMFARDQTATDPAALAAISSPLGDLARSSLDPDPARRPVPGQWAEHLASAIPTASTAPAAAAPPPRPHHARRFLLGRSARNGTAATRGRRADIAAGIFAVLLLAAGIIGGIASSVNGSPASPGLTSPSSTPYATPWNGYAQQGAAPYQQRPAYSYPPAYGYTPAPGYQAYPPVQPSPTDILSDVQMDSCYDVTGSITVADLSSAPCMSGAFQVVDFFHGTTDLHSCDGVVNSDEAVSSSLNDLVVCLSYLSPDGTAYHAHPGECVYGPNGPGPWSTEPCQTGNFKVLAVYTSNASVPCNTWPHYDQWKAFVAPNGGQDVQLCLTMNYPDDAGDATINECLSMSGPADHPIFTNVGSCAASNVEVVGRTNTYDDAAFCGQYASVYWEPNDYPSLAYTVCFRSL